MDLVAGDDRYVEHVVRLLGGLDMAVGGDGLGIAEITQTPSRALARQGTHLTLTPFIDGGGDLARFLIQMFGSRARNRDGAGFALRMEAPA